MIAETRASLRTRRGKSPLHEDVVYAMRSRRVTAIVETLASSPTREELLRSPAAALSHEAALRSRRELASMEILADLSTNHPEVDILPLLLAQEVYASLSRMEAVIVEILANFPMRVALLAEMPSRTSLQTDDLIEAVDPKVSAFPSRTEAVIAETLAAIPTI